MKWTKWTANGVFVSVHFAKSLCAQIGVRMGSVCNGQSCLLDVTMKVLEMSAHWDAERWDNKSQRGKFCLKRGASMQNERANIMTNIVGNIMNSDGVMKRDKQAAML